MRIAAAIFLMVMPLGSAVSAQSSSPSAPDERSPITSAPQQPLPLALVSRLPPCAADQLLVTTEEQGGDFNGMSHAGVLIILRNNGNKVCRLLPLAQASLLDKEGRLVGPFSTTPSHAYGMHPGPVVLPVAVATHAELTATLRWVDAPVFIDNLCLHPAALLLKFGDLTIKAPLVGQLCGERSKGVSAELSRFTPDQVPVAAASR